MDSNSGGYAHGWINDDTKTPTWVWYGNQSYGSYEFESDTLDQLVIDKDVLIVYSSGNDGTDSGPPAAPFAHLHDFGIEPKGRIIGNGIGRSPNTPVSMSKGSKPYCS